MVTALMRDIEVGVVNLMVLRTEGARTAWHYTHRLARVDRHLLQPPFRTLITIFYISSSISSSI
jgi:hypothetical protein